MVLTWELEGVDMTVGSGLLPYLMEESPSFASCSMKHPLEKTLVVQAESVEAVVRALDRFEAALPEEQ